MKLVILNWFSVFGLVITFTDVHKIFAFAVVVTALYLNVKKIISGWKEKNEK